MNMDTHVDERKNELIEYMEKTKKQSHPESCLIAILHKAQQLYGYLSKEVMDEVATTMNIPTAHIWGVATFYHYFNLAPQGAHTIYVCLGTACFVKGAGKVLDAVKEELKISVGETTPDNLFSLRETRCLGACGLAPVIMVDDKMYGELTPKKAVEILRSYKK
ncbi:MAG: NADH-quinone oxidoreductase subunit NuoE [Candidatus Omnitrophica bacterium]|nr:NADH-quinone oxidoreductase subunit NuoE [Candidatus Omnitrophota bacterium]